MKKRELRNEYLKKRIAFSAADYAARNEAILERVKQHVDFAAVKVLHVFLPFLDRKEVDTRLINEYVSKNFPHVDIVVPKSNFDDITMESYRVDEHMELHETKLGIDEPETGTFVEPGKIDLVIAPLVIFDKKGYRVGYGKGFYDRFLKTCRPDVRTVGLCFFEPVETIDDVNEFDVPMNSCITPEKIWTF
ncbi:MAG: 5-formyltetrahydrofolate cyclo-ligase [Mucilaginibacter polytrichastri]|nr:5-formyltetrahydrofolate cyclo-ligase [Mucilaginibacter polytrichastri]